MREQTIQTIYSSGIIAILRGLTADQAKHTAEALVAGGIRLIEVTFDAKRPEDYRETQLAISNVAQALEGYGCVGAGTVMHPQQVQQAADAGAGYIISPVWDRAVIQKTRDLDLVSIPGAMSPSEIIAAHQAGADFVKLFPAAALGVEYLKSILSPISHVPILVVGGIDLANLADFLAAGAVGAGIGGKLADKAVIKSGHYDALTKVAEDYISIMNTWRTKK